MRQTGGYRRGRTVGTSPRRRAALLEVVTDLVDDVRATSFPLELAGAAELRTLRERLLTQLSVHLLPRLQQGDVPTLVVLGGSTGAGKSTLLNTVVGREVSPAGVLRPTTQEPVVVVHPEDQGVMEGHPIADLARLVVDDGAPRGLALLDAPDLDSVHDRNRALAEALLDTADLWVFVTTGSRYGDAVPWRVLVDARERGVSTAVVLNRVRREVLVDVRADLLRRLDSLGLGSAPMFVVPDAGPQEGPLPPEALAELTQWFGLLATRHQSPGIVRRTARGIWRNLRAELLTLGAGAGAQLEAADRLRALARQAATGPAEKIVATLERGTAAHGAPTTRWLALASTAGPLAPLATRHGRLRRGWGGATLAARDSAAQRLGHDTRAAVAALVAEAGGEAAGAARRAWAAEELGAAAVLARLDAERAAVRIAEDAAEQWADAVLADVEAGARAPSAALSPAGVAALVQAGAAGLEGATRAVRSILGPEGTAAVARARADLAARAAAAVHRVGEHFADAVDDLGLRPEPATALRLRAGELKGQV